MLPLLATAWALADAPCALGQSEAAPPAGIALNVRDFGATGDSQTDDTAALQKALDAAGAAGGGIVWAPRGNYRVAGHLVLPDDVTLEGVWTVPTAWTQNRGTTLLAEEGRGSTEGPPFIMLQRNSTLKGLAVFYPGQTATDPQPYPWCVGGSGADNPSIVDVMLVNPYNGVDFATRASGRHYIRNLYGQPLCVGVQVDKCYDVGRIENVHFWPFWTQEAATIEFLRLHGRAFVFGRTDWQYVLNTFSWGYKIGYHFIATEAGACNGNFLGIGADATNVAVQVDQCSPIGLLITNGEFVSFLEPHPAELVVDAANTGLVQLTNCAFWGPTDRCATIRGSGAVSLQQCHFMHWDRQGKGLSAIECAGGDLTVSACRFAMPSPAIHLGQGLRTATIFGNWFAGPQQVRDDSGAPVQVGLNNTPAPPTP